MNDMETSAARLLQPLAGRQGGGGSRPATDAWLREMERARWAAQPRYDAPWDGAAGTATPAAEAAPLAHGTMAGGVGDLPPSGAGPSGPTVAVTPEEGRGAAMPSTESPQQTAERSDRAGAAFASPVASVATGPAGGADSVPVGPRRSAARSRAGTARDWQPRSMHVERNGSDVAVWVRDAHLGAQDALQLLERLSRTFSGSSTTAGTLRLTVNGQPVRRADVYVYGHAQQERKSHGG